LGCGEGTARIIVDGEERVLRPGESTFIPIGSVHRLENPGKIDLEVIEVQIGEYLGEDDIERLEDDYKR
jgi:mannose-6-phosphate isomerase-like protein (cupin superfamily)